MKGFYNNGNVNTENIATAMNDFTASLNLPSLDNNEVQMCDEPITIEEASAALKTMKSGSSPGTDGIPVEFYQVFWLYVKKPLFESYEFSFNSGCLAPSEREAVISLIFKGKDLRSDKLENWRPISLTNIDYKILAKVFSLRLSKVIDKLIGSQQVGFLKNRNIAVIHRQIDDLLDQQRKLGRPGILFAADFKQAFDSISTEYVISCLKTFGFGQNFIKWVGILNTDRQTCIKNGGYVSRFFSMSNGVRQGCPLSPQLFIIAAEILAQKIIQDVNISGLNPCESSQSMKVSQLADDTSLYLNGYDDLKHTIKHFNNFAIFSGLYLNLNKSSLLSTNGDNIDTGDINIKFENTVKILGIHFSNERSASEIEMNWTKRIDQILHTLTKWSRRNLSLAGKVVILKTFALSQLVFLMQSITLPEKVLDKINSIFFRFLWKRRFSNKRAYEKIKRKVLTNEYEHGGLRMVDVHRFQKSVLLNWVDQLLSKNSEPWKGLASEYYSNLGGLNVFKSSTNSKMLKGIEAIEHPFWKQALCCWLDNAGKDAQGICFLNDPIFNNKLVTYRGNTLFLPSCIRRGIVTIGDMVQNGRVLSLQEFIEKFGNYPRGIMDHNLLFNALNNLMLSGSCSLKNVDHLYQGRKVELLGRQFYYSSLYKTYTPICKAVWKRKYNIDLDEPYWNMINQIQEPRVKSLCWKIAHNIYPTNILLYKMGISSSMKCKDCDANDYLEHFFVTCKKVQGLWQEIEKDINLYIGKNVTLKEQHILLGIPKIQGINSKKTKKINLAIALGKVTISKFKYGKNRNIMEIYETECRLRKFWS